MVKKDFEELEEQLDKLSAVAKEIREDHPDGWSVET